MRRTLGINKIKLWVVNKTGQTEVVDTDGFYTGELVDVYSIPEIVYLTLYPSNGAIIEQLFGKDVSLDMVAVSGDVDLLENTLLFLTEPVDSFYTSYDYRVSSIKKSLNTFQYGLKRRE